MSFRFELCRKLNCFWLHLTWSLVDKLSSKAAVIRSNLLKTEQTMLLFQTILNNFERMGIRRKQNPFRRQLIVNLTVNGSLSIWATASLYQREHNLNDYMEYIFMITASIVFIVSFAIVHTTQKKIFELVDTCERIVLKRKWMDCHLTTKNKRSYFCRTRRTNNADFLQAS